MMKNASPAEIPQRRTEPQPPMSPTEYPSDPSRNPGVANAMTKPSHQRSFLRS